MAILIQAIASYAPRIDLGEVADAETFMEMITARTTLSAGVVKNVQESEVETLISLLKQGRRVHSGVAVFTPSIDTKGRLSVNVKVDKRITSMINRQGVFKGKINNVQNIGLTREQYVALWNEGHPEDPILLEPQGPSLLVSPGLQMPS